MWFPLSSPEPCIENAARGRSGASVCPAQAERGDLWGGAQAGTHAPETARRVAPPRNTLTHGKAFSVPPCSDFAACKPEFVRILFRF